MSEHDKKPPEYFIQSAIKFAEEHEPPYVGGTPRLENLQPHRNWAEPMLYQFGGPKRGSEKNGSV